jgi:ribosomal protein S18 acetylase RimI-like enzyme
MIEIREVKTKKEFRKFINFHYQLYKGNPYWVPPLYQDEVDTLSKEKNPAFDYCDLTMWNAYKDGELKGRIACILNHNQEEKEGMLIARFGWIDFVDDIEVSEALIQTAETYAREHGAVKLTGPMGFCDFDKQGLLVEGFEELGSMVTLYNHPYYAGHIERLGYIKDVDMVEHQIINGDRVPERLERLAEIVLQRTKLKFVPLKKTKDVLAYAKGIFTVLNEAYRVLHGVTEIPEKQMEYLTKQYFSFVDPDYIKIVVDENNEVVAFGIAMPSLSKALQTNNGRLFPFGFIPVLRALKKNDRLELYFVGVKPEYQDKGVNAVLMAEMTKSGISKGIKIAETSVSLEDNAKILAFWKHWNHRLHKRRRFYIKDL